MSFGTGVDYSVTRRQTKREDVSHRSADISHNGLTTPQEETPLVVRSGHEPDYWEISQYVNPGTNTGMAASRRSTELARNSGDSDASA